MLNYGKTYYFNLLTPKNMGILISYLKDKKINIIENLKENFNTEQFTKKYLDNEISTLDYLLKINFY